MLSALPLYGITIAIFPFEETRHRAYSILKLTIKNSISILARIHASYQPSGEARESTRTTESILLEQRVSTLLRHHKDEGS
jgi:hypothetical protein